MAKPGHGRRRLKSTRANMLVNPTATAERILQDQGLDKEYSPISGNPEFCRLSINLALGDDNEVVLNGLNSTVQGISGTGSLCIGAHFLSRFFPGRREIYLPTPSWGNHTALFRLAGLSVKSYRYYDPQTCGLDFQGILDDIATELEYHRSSATSLVFMNSSNPKASTIKAS
ncbi:hypothetical protein QAD02_007233 [Eretmocerus hayati]|uniref:Uncharacterized protein n=1 Tax=Eretmocerus hayati TaxID=131215 RepID=A0ACC2N3E8_9HYME|nr:hypothetical protein QAD02_007233 [Eretmocerus hayati]